MITSNDEIGKLIQHTIRQEIENVLNDEVDVVSKRVEQKIRASVASISAKVLEHFSMERFGSELVIRVNFDNTK